MLSGPSMFDLRWMLAYFMLMVIPSHEFAWSDEEIVEPVVVLPREISDKIMEIFAKEHPGLKFIMNDQGLYAAHHLIDYRTHSRGLGPQFLQRSIVTKGPADDGFSILLSISKPGRQKGQADPESFCGRELSQEYWFRYVNSYRLSQDRSEITLDFEYGRHADLAGILKVKDYLNECGEEIYIDRRLDQRRKLSASQNRIREIVKHHAPEAKWDSDGRGNYNCEYRTLEYLIHAVDADGTVCPEIHPEVGPQVDGFLIKLSPVQAHVLRDVTPRYGRANGPYWNEYHVIYEEWDLPIRLEIRYGSKVDKNLLEEIVQALDEMFGAPPRF